MSNGLDNIIEDYQSSHPDKQGGYGRLILFLLSLPFYIRLIFYCLIYDFPIAWMGFSVVTFIGLIGFGKFTQWGWKFCWFRDHGVYAKYIALIMIPIFLTAFFEDLKLSQHAILTNAQLSSKLSGNKDESSTNIAFNTLNVVNRIGGEILYMAQIPLLGVFKGINSVRIYQQCLIKRFEGDYSEEKKDKIYRHYFKEYLKDHPSLTHGTTVGQVIHDSYSVRVKTTFNHTISKVIGFNPFDECR
jgi:hypothetical protein